MGSRLATDQEVDTWRTEGWVLLEGLVSTDEIDAAAEDLEKVFPTNEQFQADPAGVTEQWKGHPKIPEEAFVWPEDGPGFRPEQHEWSGTFPFPGDGHLNRLVVHPSIVDFAERAIGDRDIRLYQIHAAAKYEGIINYEQPMHTDRNHSWIPAIGKAPWWNLEGFLYMTDVTEDENATRLVSLRDTSGVSPEFPLIMPSYRPDLYEAEKAATGVRGSYLAYRSDTFHRGAAFNKPGTGRAVLALAFRNWAHRWIGYDESQSRATDGGWVRFVEESSPRELELFGFPPPGHEIWDEELLEETKRRYPKMDITPWKKALS
jgi:hypothetical protein